MRIIYCLFFIVAISAGQESVLDNRSDIIDDFIDEQNLDQDAVQSAEEMENLLANPVNIAQASISDLLSIPMISPLLAESIIRFRDTVVITDISQLQSVDLMTPILFDIISPMIAVYPNNNSTDAFLFASPSVVSRTRYDRRLQITRGERDGKYLGDPFTTYQRINIQNKVLHLSLVAKKDAGEQYKHGFVGGNIEIRNISVIERFVLGKFAVASSQGLVVAKNISSTKGGDAVGQTKKRGAFITPSTSTVETGAFQGAGSSIQLGGITMTGFFSMRKMSASLDSLDQVSSWTTPGAYRTEADLRRKNILEEQIIGTIATVRVAESSSLSLTALNISYDRPLALSAIGNKTITSLTAGSFSWDISIQSMILYGEAATNNGKTYSNVVGATFPIAKSLAFVFHHRMLSTGYYSPFARPFSETNDIASGESGNYVGMEISLGNINISAYRDAYSIPPKNNEFGFGGTEYFVQTKIPITKSYSVKCHLRSKVKESENDRRQNNYRFSHEWRITRNVSVMQRIEFLDLQYRAFGDNEKGFLTFVDCSIKKIADLFHLKTRLVLFDTKSYDSRLYQYESDVPGHYSNPPMYGKGIRWYCIGGGQLFDDFRLSLKYSETKRLHESLIGSGNDEIIGNFDNSIVLQIDFQM